MWRFWFKFSCRPFLPLVKRDMNHISWNHAHTGIRRKLSVILWKAHCSVSEQVQPLEGAKSGGSIKKWAITLYYNNKYSCLGYFEAVATLYLFLYPSLSLFSFQSSLPLVWRVRKEMGLPQVSSQPGSLIIVVAPVVTCADTLCWLRNLPVELICFSVTPLEKKWIVTVLGFCEWKVSRLVVIQVSITS